MDSVTCLNIIRDSLRANLTDPYVTGGGSSRGGAYWVFADQPISGGKYPQVVLKKFDNPTEVLDIGYDYEEFEQLYIDVWFYSKNGFKITVGGTEYVNAQLVEYYQGLIKSTLKAQASTLHTAGAKMYKHINTSPIAYDSETQLYFGSVTIRVAYFNQ